MHVAMIMDGNGRWARQRGLPRSAGHRQGAKAVRQVTETAAEQDISVLTLYAFSSDNWQRPTAEVQVLMALLEEYLHKEIPRCLENGIRLNVIGRRDRLKPSLVKAIEHAEAKTAQQDRMLLRVAVDYSARYSIAMAGAQLATKASIEQEEFWPALEQAIHSVPGAGPVDLLIRTGGEQRLSDFLLWECAYAELLFVEKMWPDFNGGDLTQALEQFGTRERRYGRILTAVGEN